MGENPKRIDPAAARFVSEVIQKLQKDTKRKKKDTKFRAEMTRADNPATKMQAWPELVQYCDLETKSQQLSFALIGACMARVRAETNGSQSFGEALRMCKENPEDDDERIERKLLRVLACKNTQELVKVLRPLLRYMVSQEDVSLNYAQLLTDILRFSEDTKIRWASQYYGYKPGPHMTQQFVSYVLQKLQEGDTGFRAKMKRADNPATEMQAWSELARFCELKEHKRLPLALIGACMVRVRTEENGTQAFGEALRMCKESPSEDDKRIERKLRRILACDSTLELVQVLRSILPFVVNQERVSLDYEKLLKEILRFDGEKAREYTKRRWAYQYYTPKKKKEKEE